MIWDQANRHNFFTHSKRYPVYANQIKEIADILTEKMGEDSKFVESILDVGCGNYRFKELFNAFNYTGIDLEYGVDITKPWVNYKDKIEPKYDLVFTSLVLMCFPQEVMEKILVEMFAHSRRHVFIYEGIEENNDDKFINNYDLFPDMLVASGISKVSDIWIWKLWRK